MMERGKGMRLIDVDAINGTFVKNENYRGAEVMALLNQQPIAYDVDKAVEQLEERLKSIRKEQTADCIKHDGHWTPEQGMRSGMIKAYLKSLEIVKSGG